MRLILVGLAILCTTCTGDAAPHARAQRIQVSSELIGGPKAIGEIGDFLLENDKIRVIIHGNKPGRGNTLYGGTLIDADLVRVGGSGGTAGNDQLAEILPAFLFTVIEPTDITVTRDGADGGPAEVTVTGRGGDLLQLAALLVAGMLFPANLDFAVTYSLAPGTNYVAIRASITNNSAGAHPLPFLDPAAIAAQLPEIPGLADLQLSVPFGEMLLFGGEQAMFAPGTTGFDVRFGIEDSYATAAGFPAFPGLVVDHVATRGNGVSYGFAVPAGPDNYVGAFADRYADQTVTPTSFLLAFNYASVAGAYTTNPPTVLAAGDTFEYTSYFIVGRGDAASVHDTVLALRDAAVGTFSGRVVDALTQAAPPPLSIVILDAGGRFVTQADSDAGGAFTADLEPGDYRYHVVDDDRPPLAEGAFTIARDATTSRLIQVGARGHVAVFVTDETGRPAPAKVTLLAEFDAAHAGDDPRDFLYSLALGERVRPTAFEGARRDYIEAVIYGPSGQIAGDVRPGRYDVVVSRGPEYEVHREEVTIAPGQTVTSTVRLTRAFETPGWISADVHLHSGPSTDSGLSIDDRVLACAAEGVDLAVSTEHNFIADYEPSISRLGLTDWIGGMVGIELTTFEMGHFNAYPLVVDAGSTRGGEFVWTRTPPADMFAQLRGLGRDPDRTIIQVNHPREQVLGYFASFFLDAETGEPYIPQGLRAVFAPYGDEFQPDAFSYDFDAIELITGKHLFAIHSYRAPDPLPPGEFPDPQPVPGEIVRGPDGRPVYPGTVESWFTLLDRGLRPTGMGSSDSHGLDDEAGYAKTYVFVGAGNDVPGGYREADVVDAIRAHRTVATNAPFVELEIGDGRIGDEVRAGPAIEVRVRVRAPSWAGVDHLTLWSNSVAVVDVAIPAEQATDFEASYPLVLAEDAWVVAEVTGTQSMFPIATAKEFEPLDASVVIKALGAGLDLSGLTPTGALQPDKTTVVTPFAMTSPIWVDIDGGGWTSPRPALSRDKPAAPRPAPDLRDTFDALPGAPR
jgi:hypothetical protein